MILSFDLRGYLFLPGFILALMPFRFLNTSIAIWVAGIIILAYTVIVSYLIAKVDNLLNEREIMKWLI